MSCDLVSKKWTLADHILSLPTETQGDIISQLDSREHLLALSLSGRHLHALCADQLHSTVVFDCLTPDHNIVSYLEHTVPYHAHRCHSLRLEFSLGPLIDRKADIRRANLFADIVGKTGNTLRRLAINVAGSNLCDTLPLAKAILSGQLISLKSLRLQLHDVEEHEKHVVQNLFTKLADRPNLLPVLTDLDIDGYWELSPSSDSDTVRLYQAFRDSIEALRLSSLRLACLKISEQDLSTLLRKAKLKYLHLDELEGQTASSILDAIVSSGNHQTLRYLSIALNADTLSLRTQKLTFPLLWGLQLRLARYYVSETSSSGTVSLYSSLFSQPQSKLSMPALRTLDVCDAMSQDLHTSVAISWFIAKAKVAGTLPSLSELQCDSRGPRCSRFAKHALEEEGISFSQYYDSDSAMSIIAGEALPSPLQPQSPRSPRTPASALRYTIEQFAKLGIDIKT